MDSDLQRRYNELAAENKRLRRRNKRQAKEWLLAVMDSVSEPPLFHLLLFLLLLWIIASPFAGVYFGAWLVRIAG